MSPEELEAFVIESCARHGVPTKVTDTVVVLRVATLLGGPTHRPASGGAAADGRRRPQSRHTRSTRAGSRVRLPDRPGLIVT